MSFHKPSTSVTDRKPTATTYITVFAALFAVLLFVGTESAQVSATGSKKPKSDISDTPDPTSAKPEKADSSQKYRLLQSNDFLVDTAYLQEENELQHTFTFSRTNHSNWSAVFNEEIPLGSEKHQLSFSLPAQFVGNGPDRHKGFGDARLEYNYGLIGDSASRLTISPGIGISLPVGSSRKELGAGLIFKLPVGVMLTSRFGSNSSAELTYTRSAKNGEGQRADTVGYEIGQSFVWFAKPKLNFLVETVWERSQEVIGHRSVKNEHEFLVSPGVRWAWVFKRGLIVSPGVAAPIGVGPSRGERGIFFYIAFEHLFKKEQD
jgi:hypothetical protein